MPPDAVDVVDDAPDVPGSSPSPLAVPVAPFALGTTPAAPMITRRRGLPLAVAVLRFRALPVPRAMELH